MMQVHKPSASQREDVKSGMHSPHPLLPGQNTADSLLGQPPSAPEESVRGDFVEGLEQRFDDAVASIYALTPRDPLSYIREERLDDKDIMLMDGKMKIIISIKQAVCLTKLPSGAYADFP